jgi:ABC-type arginine transport system ATPase subunit
MENTIKNPNTGFYCDESGKVQSTAEGAPEGFHFSFEEKSTYRQVLIVETQTGEVKDEYVLWPTLEALSEAGVDVSGFHKRSPLRPK